MFGYFDEFPDIRIPEWMVEAGFIDTSYHHDEYPQGRLQITESLVIEVWVNEKSEVVGASWVMHELDGKEFKRDLTTNAMETLIPYPMVPAHRLKDFLSWLYLNVTE